MKKKNHKKGLHWTTVWLFSVLALTSIVFVTFAAYTEVSSVKRVVSTTSAPAELFSSNCLRKELANRKMPSQEYTITVCNFEQERPTTYNPTKITYTLYAKLLVKDNGKYIDFSEYISKLGQDEQAKYVSKAGKYSIAKTVDDADGTLSSEEAQEFTSSNGFTVSFSGQQLTESQSSIDKYKVTIDSDDIQNASGGFYVYVWAEPTSPTNLGTISCRLYGALNASDTASWKGEFRERDGDKVDYDFYNYIISGSGSGTLDILWDPTKLEINEFFFSEFSGVNFLNGKKSPETITDETSQYYNWNKVTIVVDATIQSRYELQLYKTAPGVSYTGDQVATNYIAYSFHKE